MESTYEEPFEKGDTLSVTMQRIYFLGIEVHTCIDDNLNPKYLNDL